MHMLKAAKSSIVSDPPLKWWQEDIWLQKKLCTSWFGVCFFFVFFFPWLYSKLGYYKISQIL
jgi:hypothetical protein